MRLCRLSSLVVAMVLIVLSTAASPASAAVAHRLNTVLDPITIAPGTPEDSYLASLSGVLAQRDVPARPHRIAYTIDLTEVADLVELGFEGIQDVIVAAAAEEDPCQLRGTIFHCLRTGVRPAAGWVIMLGSFSVTPTSNARSGDGGQITVTARVDEGPITTSTSQVRIGESVDLATLNKEKVSAAPGRAVRVSPRVRNVGTAPVRGAVLGIWADRKLIDTDASNCFYSYQIFCVFDTALAPGRTYALATPLVLRTPADAAAGSRADVGLSWLTPALWEDQKKILHGLQGKPGRGTALRLVPAAGAAEVPQVDVDGDNDQGLVQLTVAGSRRPALAISAPAVTLAPGRTATVRFGITNRGPGTLYPTLFGNTALSTWLTLPKGVTVAKADKRCYPEFARSEWSCHQGDAALPAGHATTFVFRLTAAKGFTGASARVEVRDAWLDGARVLRIGVSAGGAGGGLPVSGPTAWPGLLLVVLGAVLLRVGRRAR
ncbi:hypothetical protein AB0M36_20060 [Actinoplanes sp. NPDC051346]|uniref:hypothetical protein n=1 Tax=Actinoplanes sp. NPDC051346 TaxID=3155048 RepID=UPI00343299EA